ncbi:EAL domain-containing protein [Levilactobacillus hammesii]|uniref:Diguanylate cyclase phosphodiesterase domain 2 containing protein n=1 Tax=Levilactobacillus hammesii DSM 16381 TaxID=1423753 RepID=A0A0R1UIV8_9LACO|nr:EAL domain-containing protein [Levilactobacillus hammesii]KRL93198.1 diguanylate cyclase phosphodiesterase domain 2 containing protein [Levilactobacillus hammesii DSM 16381]
MSLAQLESYLLWATAVMAVIVVLTIGFYYWYSRKTTNNYLENDEIELRYFIQKQVNFRGETTGYECLLRQHNADGSWSLPQKLDSLPLQRVIFLLTDTFQSLPEEPITLSINLEFDQITSPDFRYFVRWALSRISPMKLAVEYTAGATQSRWQRWIFRRRIREARGYGMRFGVDNVGSSLNNLKSIEWILPEVDSLKCSMRSFRKADPNEWLDLNLQFWNRLSQRNHIELVLMGIENEQDQQLADQLKIKTRQGYLFARPTNPHERS